jgi:hypothetical protein
MLHVELWLDQPLPQGQTFSTIGFPRGGEEALRFGAYFEARRVAVTHALGLGLVLEDTNPLAWIMHES